MPAFEYRQAEEIREMLSRYRANFLFLGKSGAILFGFPDTTPDANLVGKKTPDNCRSLVTGVRESGFAFPDAEAAAVARGKDFVQLKKQHRQ